VRGRPAVLALLFVAGWAVVAPAPAALAYEILLLRSRDQPLYNHAVDGIEESFRADQGERVTLVDVDDLKLGHTLTSSLPDPDVVISVGASATGEAARRFPDKPIIYCMVIRPERLKLTPYSVGISMFVPLGDMVATLALISPGIHHVGVLHGPEHSAMLRGEIDRLAGFETTIIPVEIKDDRDLPALARKLVLQSDALWIVPGSLSGAEAYQFLLRLSFEHHVPLVGDSPSLVKAGAFISITPDPADMGRQAGRLASYLIRGEGLPPDRMFFPDMASLSLNLHTARSLGIEIPPLVRDFATVVVQ